MENRIPICKGVLLQYQGGVWASVSFPNIDEWYLSGLHFIIPNDGWVVGDAGELHHYSKGTWRQVKPPQVSEQWGLSSVHFTSPEEGWAVGKDMENKRGIILHYMNGIWSSVTTPMIQGWLFEDVHFTSPDEGWAVGCGGVLLHYMNGIWRQETLAEAYSLYGIHFTSPDDGWAVGDDETEEISGLSYLSKGLLLHYTNGTWTPTKLQALTMVTCLNGIHFTSSNDGWAVGSEINGKPLLLRFQNSIWAQFTSPEVNGSCHLSSVHFISPDEGWAVGEISLNGIERSGILFHYVDGVWTRVTSPAIRENWLLSDVQFTSPDEGWAVGFSWVESQHQT